MQLCGIIQTTLNHTTSNVYVIFLHSTGKHLIQAATGQLLQLSGSAVVICTRVSVALLVREDKSATVLPQQGGLVVCHDPWCAYRYDLVVHVQPLS